MIGFVELTKRMVTGSLFITFSSCESIKDLFFTLHDKIIVKCTFLWSPLLMHSSIEHLVGDELPVEAGA